MSATLINRRRRHTDESEWSPTAEHPFFSRATGIWAGAGMLVGTGLSLYGANKQAKSQAATDATNRAAIQESDLNQWKAYLIQRGLNPQGVTQYGQVPQNAQPMNTKLPLWAQMSFTQPASPAGTSMVRRRTRA